MTPTTASFKQNAKTAVADRDLARALAGLPRAEAAAAVA